ncbi:MAG: V-type ATP synthase subunit D, partial [Erysipelotrichaceae bacterium]
MSKQVFPTKGNLIATKKSSDLAKMGYDLMDRKRNILIREMMDLLDDVKLIREQISDTYAVAYMALQE